MCKQITIMFTQYISFEVLFFLGWKASTLIYGTYSITHVLHVFDRYIHDFLCILYFLYIR